MNANETDCGSGQARSTQGRFLVIGYGNPLRGDDGAGPLVAETLEALALPGLETRVRHQLTPELALEMGPGDTVIFVDAVPAGEGEAKDPEAVRLPRVEGKPWTGVLSWTGHRCSPETLLEWARVVGGVSVRSWVLGIPGYRFDWGFELTPKAREGVASAVEVVRSLWEAWRIRAGPFVEPQAAPGSEAESPGR